MRLGFSALVLASLLAPPFGVWADEPAEKSADKPSDTQTESAPASDDPKPDPHRWCAAELSGLAHDVCAFVPKAPKGPRTLVIYLHGVIQPDTLSQWTLQRGAARVGAQYGLTVIMPRGRRGIGPTNMEQWWTWPTSVDTRIAHEESLLAEWSEARATLERQAGKPFERVYVFGFSNGAYYATSLAMRGRLDVDGYALFAGGSGASYHEIEAKKAKRKAPIAVAWGEGDPSHDKQEALAKLLKRLKWPHKSLGRRKAGHAMTDEQVEEALAFLGKK